MNPSGNLSINLFPFHEYWWFYAGFSVLVLILVTLDLGLFHRKAHSIGFREALLTTMGWIALAGVFNYAFYHYCLWRFPLDRRLQAIPGFDAVAAAKRAALEFLTGYIVEDTLSVDNMFVFVLIFAYFRIPPQLQHRVLYYGIAGAIVFRSIFIALGSLLLGYTWVIWLFGGFLVITGIRMLFSDKDSGQPDLDNNWMLRVLRRAIPVTSRLHGKSFFAEEGGRRKATPLFLALLLVEASDIVFAIDSVPAIFALTKEPFIVFTSNIFAILGLRSLYFLLAGAVHRFHLLQYGLAVILIFIGLKMAWLNEAFGGHFPIVWSLGLIGGVLALSIGLSLAFPKKQPVSSGA